MASYVVSVPSMNSPSTSTSPQKTNSLAITALPKEFFHPHILGVLREHFESYGEINQWVLLPGFGRILVVYHDEDNAERAKRQCDPIVLNKTSDRSEVTLRVYRADPNPIIPPDETNFIPQANYLRPPEIEKNFLISPPGSPPVGWEPIKEDPPNAAPLADDLIAALRQLQIQEKRSSLEVLLDPQEGSGVGVYVEDCDGYQEEEVDEEDWVYGQTALARQRWRPVATAMPPMRSALVV